MNRIVEHPDLIVDRQAAETAFSLGCVKSQNALVGHARDEA